jgi:EAL domain-containing protein (putative c-di-GMP-specific phosphodiesterase class I)/GGDEF domain-containing protein
VAHWRSTARRWAENVSHTCSSIDKLKFIAYARPKVLAGIIAAALIDLLAVGSACAGIQGAPMAVTLGAASICTLACIGCLCVLSYLLGSPRKRRGIHDVITARSLEDLPGRRGRFETQAPESTANGEASSLLSKEAFLTEVNLQIQRGSSAGLIAVVRMADFDKVAAFDHHVAQAGLQRFGRRLLSILRKSSATCQLQRDSFAIWLPSVGADNPVIELRSIAYALREDIQLPASTISPDVRVGCAISPRDGEDAATLLANASAAVPDRPSADGMVISEFTPVTAASARRTFLIQQGLHSAIAGEQLLLKYQPVVDLREKRIVGAEALLRWVHPELGQLSPTEFVPVLEQSTMIDEVGSWVLNTACREARSWRRQGLAGLAVAVNVSARQFRNQTLPKLVSQTLANHGLPASALEIELTETAALEESVRTRDVLQRLRALGVGVAIDDFGVGFSSLSYLKKLPLTKLKIDREFVVDVHRRADSRAICSALIALAKGLSIKVLAEGVEKKEEVDTLLDLGCVTFQGFFFYRPLTSDDFTRSVVEGAWAGSIDASSAHNQTRMPGWRDGQLAEVSEVGAQ